jgi:hypothetical protein
VTEGCGDVSFFEGRYAVLEKASGGRAEGAGTMPIRQTRCFSSYMRRRMRAAAALPCSSPPSLLRVPTTWFEAL